MISDYWFERKEMPEGIQSRIKSMVVGREADSILINSVSRKLLCVEGDVFGKVFTENRKHLYRGEFTVPAEDNDYENAVNYLTEDGLAGFSIANTGWLVSVFSNYSFHGFVLSVSKNIREKADKIICILTDNEKPNSLIEVYKRYCGFKEYAVTEDDSEYMRSQYGEEYYNAFVERHGIPYHLFLVKIDRNRGEDFIEDGVVKRFEDYLMTVKHVEKTTGGR